MDMQQILAAHNIKISADAEGDLVSDRALPRDEANEIVRQLRIAGCAADGAPDHDDRKLYWIYVTPPQPVEIEGKTVQVDASGVGQGWRNATDDTCPANIQQEIAAEIINGDQDTCDGYVASNGLRYRWS